jgi:hypothetical protein
MKKCKAKFAVIPIFFKYPLVCWVFRNAQFLSTRAESAQPLSSVVSLPLEQTKRETLLLVC